MLFLCGIGFVGLVVLLTGFLMFAFPVKYVGVANWYFSKIGLGKPVSIEKYSRWYYRGSGLALSLVSLVIFYEFWVELVTYLR
jgi:multisubunit Na+/H+ antiporter MnhB subunit